VEILKEARRLDLEMEAPQSLRPGAACLGARGDLPMTANADMNAGDGERRPDTLQIKPKPLHLQGAA